MMDSKTAFFAKYIFDHTGIVYDEGNLYQLQSRLNEIIMQTDCRSLDELYDKVKGFMPPQVHQLLIDTATNNETSFFRDGHIFDTVLALMISIAQKKNGQPIRIWSAACSSGQEPYTLAMVYEKNKEKMFSSGLEIVASDISTHILARAKAGLYTQLEVQRGLNVIDLMDYFEESPSESKHEFPWKVKDSLKNYIRFMNLNLYQALPDMGGEFDIILLRNMLIYQNIDGKKQIVERVSSKLNDGGYFILGGAESLFNITDVFESVQIEGSIVYQKKSDIIRQAV